MGYMTRKNCPLQNLLQSGNICTLIKNCKDGKMSTKERYMNEVWSGLLRCSFEKSASGHAWVRVASVATEAGVSRPTAKKYLQMLVEMEAVEWMDLDGYIVLRPIKQAQASV